MANKHPVFPWIISAFPLHLRSIRLFLHTRNNSQHYRNLFSCYDFLESRFSKFNSGKINLKGWAQSNKASTPTWHRNLLTRCVSGTKIYPTSFEIFYASLGIHMRSDSIKLQICMSQFGGCSAENVEFFPAMI